MNSYVTGKSYAADNLVDREPLQGTVRMLCTAKMNLFLLFVACVCGLYPVISLAPSAAGASQARLSLDFETYRARITGDDEILLARRPVSPFTSWEMP